MPLEDLKPYLQELGSLQDKLKKKEVTLKKRDEETSVMLFELEDLLEKNKETLEMERNEEVGYT